MNSIREFITKGWIRQYGGSSYFLVCPVCRACLREIESDIQDHEAWHESSKEEQIDSVLRSLRVMAHKREAILQEADGSTVTEDQLPDETLKHFVERVREEEEEDNAFVAGIYNESSEDEQAEHMLEGP